MESIKTFTAGRKFKLFLEDLKQDVTVCSCIVFLNAKYDYPNSLMYNL